MSEKIQSDEISKLLTEKIKNYNKIINATNTGTVLEVYDGIARIYGLSDAMMSELIQFGEKKPDGNGNYFDSFDDDHAVMGMIMNLEEDNVGCVLLGSQEGIDEGDPVRRTGKVVSVPVGEALLGRVVDALGNPLDGKGPIHAAASKPVETRAPGIIARQPVKESLATGIKSIDSMIPIGRGQRELIIGDRQTGKTAIAVDTIINQKNSDVVCIYVAIGQKQSTVASVVNTLEKNGAMDYTIVVSASASDAAALQYLAPYSGCAMGEYFRDNKKHALIVYDDLSKHAVAYRELSLLLKRPPGREAYPGDIFYLHARLLERAAKLSDELGGGSLTALPIVETQAGDISAYIPTNIISITDGQIFLISDLFYSGVRPAIDVNTSVSRVGSSAQKKAMKKVTGSLKIDLANYWELAEYAKLSSDLDATTKAQLTRGERIVEILKQPQYAPLSLADECFIVYAVNNGYLDDVPTDKCAAFQAGLVEHMKSQHPYIGQRIENTGVIDEQSIKGLEQAIEEYKALQKA